jgi:hypothetical protein
VCWEVAECSQGLREEYAHVGRAAEGHVSAEAPPPPPHGVTLWRTGEERQAVNERSLAGKEALLVKVAEGAQRPRPTAHITRFAPDISHLGRLFAEFLAPVTLGSSDAYLSGLALHHLVIFGATQASSPGSSPSPWPCYRCASGWGI